MPCPVWNVPAPHGKHKLAFMAPSADWNVPALHSLHPSSDTDPSAVEYVPALHNEQLLGSSIPDPLWYVPAPHDITDPSTQKAPAGHAAEQFVPHQPPKHSHIDPSPVQCPCPLQAPHDEQLSTQDPPNTFGMHASHRRPPCKPTQRMQSRELLMPTPVW